MVYNFAPKTKKGSIQSSDFQRVCAWCGRMYVNNRWLNRRPNEDQPVTHGVCPECYAVIMAKLERND